MGEDRLNGASGNLHVVHPYTNGRRDSGELERHTPKHGSNVSFTRPSGEEQLKLTSIADIIKFAAPLLNLLGATDQAHDAVKRALTPNKATRDFLFKNLSEDEKAEAAKLLDTATEAQADLVLFLATQGEYDTEI